jgi:Family of unknown function (DUF6444)
MSNPSSEPNLHTDWPFPFSQADWAQTPPAVQAYIAALQQELNQLKQRVEALEARTHTTSETSSRPPSSDSPFRKGRKKRDRTTVGRPGAKPGHPGVRQTLLSPTSTTHLMPTECRCGNRAFTHTAPYYTHQVIELPPITMDITHWVLHQADCPSCGQRVKAQLPPRAPHRIRPSAQRPDGRNGRCAGHQPLPHSDVLCLSTRLPHRSGSHPESPRPRHPGPPTPL